MEKFISFLKFLQEDKLLTKEDEGAVSTGDIAPSSNATANDVMVGDAAGVTYDEIMGKCDHKRDGFFGPGCMHRPFPVFSKVQSRIPSKKKKRKYIKVLDLTESSEYGDFKTKATPMIAKNIEEANSYLKRISPDLRCEYEEDYDFLDDKQNWVAALDKETQENQNTMKVAINLPVVYGFLEDNGLIEDETELNCQIKASIWHEIAHGIIQYLRDTETYDMELSNSDEENVAEEFSNYMMREFTHARSSRLNDFIVQVFGTVENPENTDNLK